jgi:hypothetical protein
VAQNVYKFDRGILEEHGVTRVQITRRSKDDWVCFLWTKHGQEAPGRGVNSLEALETAIAYLHKTFQYPILARAESIMQPPDRRPGIRRNPNGRLLSTKEMLVERFLAKKADMEVLLPSDDMKEVEKTTVLPVGYADIQFGHHEVVMPDEDMAHLRKTFDNMSATEYQGQNRYLMWLKTLAMKIRELAPIDHVQSAVVATAQHGLNRFCYFHVGKVDREIVVEGKEPVIINFSRNENFQVQLFGMDPRVIFPESVPAGSDPWTRVDL